MFSFSYSYVTGILFYCILPTSRHTRCAEMVIENNADCNNVGNDGMPLLVLACFEANENEKICQLLLDHAADPNSVHPVSELFLISKQKQRFFISLIYLINYRDNWSFVFSNAVIII